MSDLKIIDTIEVSDDDLDKKATIRGESVRDCPFGLPVPAACLNVGKAINRMAPVDEKENISKANRLVYAYHKGCDKCPYADKVLEKQEKVDCDFGDNAAGMRSIPFRGSPMYSRTTVGVGMDDGMYGYPLGYYSNNNESRNLFFGLFSMLGAEKPADITKISSRVGSKDDLDFIEKLQKTKEEYKEAFEELEKHLAKYRQEYSETKGDPSLIYEMSDSWFGPRKI
jgi:hypothetical protein